MGKFLDSVPFSGIIRIRDMMYGVKDPFRLDQGDVSFDSPDTVKAAMRRAIDETTRRREKQEAYNEEHGIEPRTVIRSINDSLATILKAEYADLTEEETAATPLEFSTQAELDTYIAKLETEMRESAKKFEFEKAATLRDTIKELRTKEFLFS